MDIESSPPASNYSRSRDTFGHSQLSIDQEKPQKSVATNLGNLFAQDYNSAESQAFSFRRAFVNDEDGKRLVGAMSQMVDLEKQLEALDYKNDPEAMDKQAEIIDQLLTFSMGIAPLTRQLATGDNTRDKTTGSGAKPAEGSEA